MVQPRRHLTSTELAPIFERIRRENHVPESFPPAVVRATDELVRTGASPSTTPADRRDLALISIDPAGSRDLDQAVHVARLGSGYRFSYAIADVASWVAPTTAIDEEARRRGVTVYCPDRRVPLHPPELSEGVASLLEGQERPALLWTIDLDQRGAVSDVDVVRATVVNREQLSYAEAQRRLDGDGAGPSLRLIEEVGRLRVDLEVARGGISLRLPEQSVERHGNDYSIHYEATLPVETWNAQMSLCCGMAAADLMLSAGQGILRTLPDAEDDAVAELRTQAAALGVEWPAAMSYANWVRSLHPDSPTGGALLATAARSFRGAGYLVFDGHLPDAHHHGAIAAPYAHVTAPLRRLVDRFSSEFALASAAGRPPEGWALEALEALPGLMGDANRRAGSVDRAVIDVVEAAVMASRVGETFAAVVTSVRGDSARVQIRDPAVIASIEPGRFRPGDEIDVVLSAVDIERGHLDLTVV